jgi:hypothetical protein
MAYAKGQVDVCACKKVKFKLFLSPSMYSTYKVVQIWPGQTVTCLHTNRPGHIWTTLYMANINVVVEILGPHGETTNVDCLTMKTKAKFFFETLGNIYQP